MMDAFTTWYGGDAAERTMFVDRVTGITLAIYWGDHPVQLRCCRSSCGCGGCA